VRPRLSTRELNVVESYLDGLLAELLFEDGGAETGE
jgi:hypothetical protein